MEFIPFTEIRKTDKVVIVDSYFKGKPMLSHWRGAPKLEGIQDDTSTAIVLNALKAGHPACGLPFVSNNHFDIDGFIGIWALMNPTLALEHEELLREVALIGDFREWKSSNKVSDYALMLCSWINTVEREKFYEPFGEKDEASSCIPKYEYFLPKFEEFLREPRYCIMNPEVGAEHLRIVQHIRRLTLWGKIDRYEDIHLQVVHSREPIHYYVLFQDSEKMDMVLGLYEGNRYELEYKYVSWVDTVHRELFPRISFQSLAEKLNAIEESPYQWEYDSIMDTGPMLRLNKSGLTKAERYDHPFNREIFPSSIDKDQFLEIVLAHYRELLKTIKPRKSWTWKSMREALT